MPSDAASQELHLRRESRPSVRRFDANRRRRSLAVLLSLFEPIGPQPACSGLGTVGTVSGFWPFRRSLHAAASTKGWTPGASGRRTRGASNSSTRPERGSCGGPAGDHARGVVKAANLDGIGRTPWLVDEEGRRSCPVPVRSWFVEQRSSSKEPLKSPLSCVVRGFLNMI